MKIKVKMETGFFFHLAYFPWDSSKGVYMNASYFLLSSIFYEEDEKIDYRLVENIS